MVGSRTSNISQEQFSGGMPKIAQSSSIVKSIDSVAVFAVLTVAAVDFISFLIVGIVVVTIVIVVVVISVYVSSVAPKCACNIIDINIKSRKALFPGIIIFRTSILRIPSRNVFALNNTYNHQNLDLNAQEH